MMRAALLLALAAAVGLTGACSPPSADDLVRRVIRERNEFDVQLRSWIVREGGDDPPLYLDAMVINNNRDATLQTLTVMVEQLDEEGNLLGARRVALDVSALTPGIGQPVGVEVRPVYEGVEGVRLYVERNPPRETWREFRELDAVRPRI